MCIYTNTYTYINTHAYTHKHTNTHTYTLVYIKRENRNEKMVLKKYTTLTGTFYKLAAH